MPCATCGGSTKRRLWCSDGQRTAISCVRSESSLRSLDWTVTTAGQRSSRAPCGDAGMEVIYTGLRQTPEQIVDAALQEDADVIGLSILSGAHNHICPRLMELVKEKGLDDVLVVIGGIIPDVDVSKLNEIGVRGVFQPGTPMQAIAEFIESNVRRPTANSTASP